MNPDFSPDWKNTHLFFTQNNKFGRRLLKIIGSIGRMAGHARSLKQCDVILARNLDMLFIAWASRCLYGSRRTALIYECLDINASLTSAGLNAKVMRQVERYLLSRIAVLAVSSPGFMTNYFVKTQRYAGNWVLWENKVSLGRKLIPRPPQKEIASDAITIAWTGTIRCPVTLGLLDKATQIMNGRLKVQVHGVVHSHLASEFATCVENNPYFSYFGPYVYPDDLARVYGDCSLVWAQDLWRRGGNSDWLLPNRLYEASWCGCPSVAVAHTETGSRVASQGLGWVIAKPTAEDFVQLLEKLSANQILAKSSELLKRPAEEFVQVGEEIQRTIDTLVGKPRMQTAEQTA